MDFSDSVTLPKIKKWYDENKDTLEPLDDDDIVGYKLNISRPGWFEKIRRFSKDDVIERNCEKIEGMIFTGKSKEEIFIKMYEKCLQLLKWNGGRNDGKPVDLLDYLQPYNEVLNEMVYKIGKCYAIKSEYLFDSDDEDEDGYASGGANFIINDNKELSDKILIRNLIKDKLDFYGFTECGIYDCCFYVTELEKV